MKTFIKLISLLFAALLLFASCAQNNVIAPTTAPTASATETLAEIPTTAPTQAPFIPTVAVDLMTNIAAGNPTFKEADETFKTAVRAFDAKLFSTVARTPENKGKNLLVSPLSVMLALAMTANGAAGQTLAAFEKTLGGVPLDDLNAYLCTYLSTMPKTGASKLLFADSIWFKDDENFTVKPGFLQVNADFYGADAYAAPFDNDTVNEINDWVKYNTCGMIDKIIDKLSAKSLMHLINALYFEGTWATEFTERQVKSGTFHAYDGSSKNVEYLTRTLEGGLLYDKEVKVSDDYMSLDLSKNDAIGFTLPYEGGRYVFAALLPMEEVDVYNYAASLTGTKLKEILTRNDYRGVEVCISLPKFEAEFGASLKDALTTMGLGKAFSESADFSGITDSVSLCIGDVAHKTAITVDEKGAKAAAVTDVTPTPTSVQFDPVKVDLDRPFIYMIVDVTTWTAVFMGIQAEI